MISLTVKSSALKKKREIRNGLAPWAWFSFERLKTITKRSLYSPAGIYSTKDTVMYLTDRQREKSLIQVEINTPYTIFRGANLSQKKFRDGQWISLMIRDASNTHTHTQIYCTNTKVLFLGVRGPLPGPSSSSSQISSGLRLLFILLANTDRLKQVTTLTRECHNKHVTS